MIASYLDHLKRALHRQVEIEVQILEVTLDDTQALGINWSRLAAATNIGRNINFSIGGLVESPAGGITPLSAVLNLSASNIDSQGNNKLSAIVNALEEQGNVEIVSQPHVRTMNNQTSLIKVGTDRTFFRKEQQTDSTSAGSISTATDVPQVVTEGVVLSITPQISADGWVTMDISPVVTRVSSVTTVENNFGVIQSSAPNLDVAQVSSVVRARSGETIVVGGLIQTLDSHTRRNLPGLKSLSSIFGGQYRAVQRKELVMLLTPIVVAQQ
jgi:MSHA type pilus biogenesis protein MshL